jgi:hypothetical protein
MGDVIRPEKWAGLDRHRMEDKRIRSMGAWRIRNERRLTLDDLLGSKGR